MKTMKLSVPPVAGNPVEQMTPSSLTGPNASEPFRATTVQTNEPGGTVDQPENWDEAWFANYE